jgi:hypothetical protein
VRIPEDVVKAPLVQVISHHGGREWRRAIRETWWRPDLIDSRFIVGGHAAGLEPDVTVVDTPDDYAGISLKVREALRVAVDQGYSHVFTCFTDTYVSVPRLLASGYQHWDYSGFVPEAADWQQTSLIQDGKGRYAYASGGCGYWTSHEASRILIHHTPRSTYDDVWVGWELGLAGISCYSDPRYGFKGEQLYNSNQISVHLSKETGVYSPEQMRQAHQRSR